MSTINTNTYASSNTNHFANHEVGETLIGHFSVVGIGRRKTQGNSEWRLRLKDVLGEVFEASPLSPSLPLPDGLACSEVVAITAQEVVFQSHRWVDIISIERASIPVLKVPASMVSPLIGGVAELQNLIKRLSIQPLQEFAVEVLSDIETATAFLNRPASFSFHHSEPGGLLRHSLEVANIVWTLPGMTNVDREIALVGALFHDLGKIRTYSESRHMSTLGRLVAHDDLTLEICASALKKLDRRWPEGAAILRHVWTCASPGARYGMASKSVAADAVRFADGFSATVANHELALEIGHPSGEFIELGRQQFYDLQSPLAASEKGA